MNVLAPNGTTHIIDVVAGAGGFFDTNLVEQMHQRRPNSERPLAATATAKVEPFIARQAAELLVSHPDALTSQENMEAPITEAPADGSQIAQACPHGGIVRPGAAVPNRAPVGAQRRTRPPFAQRASRVKSHVPVFGAITASGNHHWVRSQPLACWTLGGCRSRQPNYARQVKDLAGAFDFDSDF